MLLHHTLRRHYQLTLVLLACALLTLLLAIVLVIVLQAHVVPIISAIRPDGMFPGH